MANNRKSPRLKGYDYSRDYAYFVTPVVHGRNHFFGEVMHGEMILSEFGIIAYEQMNWLKNQYLYIRIPTWVIMPNHVHAIIEIVGDEYFGVSGSFCRGRSRPTPTTDNQPAPATNHQPASVINQQTATDQQPASATDHLPGSITGNKIKSLSSLMGAYKTTTSKLIHLAGLTEFRWQRSFHDHIIRNNYEYGNIYNYIINNPLNWENDDFHSW